MSRKFYNFISYGILGIGGVAAIYIYFWLMFLKPILALCAAYGVGTLTGKGILLTLVKILLGGIPAVFVFVIAFIVAALIMNYGSEHGK